MVACKDQVINNNMIKDPLSIKFTAKAGVKYSAEMEVFALKSLLHFLRNTGMNISVLVTDRSTTVRAMLTKEFPEINHQFDIWYSGV